MLTFCCSHNSIKVTHSPTLRLPRLDSHSHNSSAPNLPFSRSASSRAKPSLVFLLYLLAEIDLSSVGRRQGHAARLGGLLILVVLLFDGARPAGPVQADPQVLAPRRGLAFCPHTSYGTRKEAGTYPDRCGRPAVHGTT